jgi:ribose 5-phosphate isomerase A
VSAAAAHKRAAAEAAARLVEPGMTVGLGSGTTAEAFVVALAAHAPGARVVATSEAIGAQAAGLGLVVVDLDAAGLIDLTVDGADDIGPGLALIKGGGAALLREKLVWEASARRVVIADDSKLKGPFGRFPLPVEVVPFGHGSTARRIDAVLEARGLAARAVLRQCQGAPVRTDNGNLIYDAACGAISDPAPLARALKQLTGVVEHGLFLGLAERALIGAEDGVRTLYP